MFLKHPSSGDLVEILDLKLLFDPNQATVTGCFHSGEEKQDPATFTKSELQFPSGEPLPRCWLDPHYRS